MQSPISRALILKGRRRPAVAARHCRLRVPHDRRGGRAAVQRTRRRASLEAERTARPLRRAEGVWTARHRPVGPLFWCGQAAREPPPRSFICQTPRSLFGPVEPLRRGCAGPGVIPGCAVDVNRRAANLGFAAGSRLRHFCRARSRRHNCRCLRRMRPITRLNEERVVGEHGCHDDARNCTHIGKNRRQQVHEHQALNLTRSTMHDRALRSAAGAPPLTAMQERSAPASAATVRARGRWRDQAAKIGTAAIFKRLIRLGAGLF